MTYDGMRNNVWALIVMTLNHYIMQLNEITVILIIMHHDNYSMNAKQLLIQLLKLVSEKG